MDVIIDSNKTNVAKDAVPLTSYGYPILNLLHCLKRSPLEYAHILAQYHHLNGAWIILSPIHWQATHNNAVISQAGNQLSCTHAELYDLFRLFSDFLAADECTLYWHNEYTWLMHSTKPLPILYAPSVYQLLNKPLMNELITVDESLYWQKFFTENQMFFASYAPNACVNGVWAWGSHQSLVNNSAYSILTDDFFLSQAVLCADNVNVYNPTICLKNYDILLIQDIDILSDVHKKQLTRRRTQWYWNNCAYYYQVPWYAKLWRL